MKKYKIIAAATNTEMPDQVTSRAQGHNYNFNIMTCIIHNSSNSSNSNSWGVVDGATIIMTTWS